MPKAWRSKTLIISNNCFALLTEPGENSRSHAPRGNADLLNCAVACARTNSMHSHAERGNEVRDKPDHPTHSRSHAPRGNAYLLVRSVAFARTNSMRSHAERGNEINQTTPHTLVPMLRVGMHIYLFAHSHAPNQLHAFQRRVWE
jgi:hypothetical protein